MITDVWRRKLNKLWTLAKFPEDGQNKPTPHRFRHTFARILLQRGVRLKDVADLPENGESICRKHYAAWITELQERLTSILKDAFNQRPKAKLIEKPAR